MAFLNNRKKDHSTLYVFLRFPSKNYLRVKKNKINSIEKGKQVKIERSQLGIDKFKVLGLEKFYLWLLKIQAHTSFY
jgi:hypothetical protein